MDIYLLRIARCLVLLSSFLFFSVGYASTLISSGDGWQLREIDSNSILEFKSISGGKSTPPRKILIFENANSISTAPIPDEFKQELEQDFVDVPDASANTRVFVDYQLVEDFTYMSDADVVTKYEEYIEAEDQWIIKEIQSKGTNTKSLSSICPKRWKFRSKSGSSFISKGNAGNSSPSDDIQFEYSVPVEGNINYRVTYKKKVRCGIPYKVKFVNTEIDGNINIGRGGYINLSADPVQLNYTSSYYDQINFTPLTTYLIPSPYTFFVGPIPVYIDLLYAQRIGFEFRYDFDALLSIGIDSSNIIDYSMTLNYVCTEVDCFNPDGGEPFQVINNSSSSGPGVDFNAGLSLDIDLGIKVNTGPQVLFGVGLGRSEGLTIGNIEIPLGIDLVKIGLFTEVDYRNKWWNYFGNTCGDSDGDGVSEFVDASAKVSETRFITYLETDIIFSRAKLNIISEEYLKSSTHITKDKYNNLFDPIISGSVNPPMEDAFYAVLQRNCIPSEIGRLKFDIDWGDGITSVLDKPSYLTYTWSDFLPKQLTARAYRGAKGFKIDAVNVSTSQVLGTTVRNVSPQEFGVNLWSLPENLYQVDYSLISRGGEHEDFIDVTGDGKADRVWLPDGEGFKLYVAKATSTGFLPPEVWLDTGAGLRLDSIRSQGDRYIDFNGDKKADRLWVQQDSNTGEESIFVSLSTGKAFDMPSIWLTESDTTNSAGRLMSMLAESIDHDTYVDLNNDGMVDRVWIPRVGGQGVYVSISLGNRFDTPKLWLGEYVDDDNRALSVLNERNTKVHYSDMNGDGFIDRVWVPEDKDALYVALSTGKEFTKPRVWLLPTIYKETNEYYDPYSKHGYEFYADMNGDGFSDKIWVPEINRVGTTGAVYVSLSNGVKFTKPSVWLDETANGLGVVPYSDSIMLKDFNNDGNLDWIWETASKTYIATSTGSGFDQAKLLIDSNLRDLDDRRINTSSDKGLHEKLTDLNGDGLLDKVWIPYRDNKLYIMLSDSNVLGVPEKILEER